MQIKCPDCGHTHEVTAGRSEEEKAGRIHYFEWHADPANMSCESVGRGYHITRQGTAYRADYSWGKLISRCP